MNSQSAPPQKQFTITNISANAVTLSKLTVTGAAAADFSALEACGTILPGGTCPILVTFNPSAAGNRSAAVNVYINGITTPVYKESVSGNGSWFSLSPSPENFGTVQTGTSLQQKITLTNYNPTTALSLSSAVLSGTNKADYTVVSNTCSSVPVNGTCTITVSFLPKATGTRTAILTVKTADGGQQTDNLTGTGN